MAIEIQWIEQGALVEYKLEGRVTQDELKQGLQQEKEFYTSAEPTHVLIDATALRRLPNDLLPARASMLLSNLTGHVAVAGGTLELRTFVQIFARLSPDKNYSFHASREDALRYLCENYLNTAV